MSLAIILRSSTLHLSSSSSPWIVFPYSGKPLETEFPDRPENLGKLFQSELISTN